MQTINLKQYYPFCTEDTFVEVSDESLKRSCWTSGPRPPGSARCTATRRFTPLTAMMGLKTPPSAGRQPSPEDCLMEKEAQAEYAELLRRLYEAISSLTPTQARRVHARYMLGMKVKDIAAMEGITPSRLGSPSMRRSGGCAGTSYAGNGTSGL